MADTRPCLPTLTPCISAHVIFFGDHVIKPFRYADVVTDHARDGPAKILAQIRGGAYSAHTVEI